MVEYDDIKFQLGSLAPKLEELTRALDITAIDAEIAKLEEQSAADGFWNDAANSSKVLQKLSSLKNKKSSLQSLTGRFEDAQTGVILLGRDVVDQKLELGLDPLVLLGVGARGGIADHRLLALALLRRAL
jgi:peptide chain release factor 2